MRKLLYLFFGVIFISSCTKSGDLELNIKAQFNGTPLVLTEARQLGDLPVKFENLAFYLADIALVNKDGEETPLSEIEFIALNSFDATGAKEGVTLRFLDLPSENYLKLKFGIGVPDDLNVKTPDDYGVEDALGQPDFYWDAWSSYIFSKTEGSVDTNGDGTFDLKFFYHTGSDALFRSFELEADIDIAANETTVLGLALDYDVLLRNADNSYMDIEAFPRNHNPEDIGVIEQLVNNYQQAIKFEN